ncbi:hypothetical protein B0J18DRAFT_290612 [Chaetomium sp. MPI-SDFR-AT-0129]|nr:hypothetical protein B0J18DRAFT_290612 [Chaetomium sp. MPI-SDFR-AT-0129]
MGKSSLLTLSIPAFTTIANHENSESIVSYFCYVLAHRLIFDTSPHTTIQSTCTVPTASIMVGRCDLFYPKPAPWTFKFSGGLVGGINLVQLVLSFRSICAENCPQSESLTFYLHRDLWFRVVMDDSVLDFFLLHPRKARKRKEARGREPQRIGRMSSLRRREQGHKADRGSYTRRFGDGAFGTGYFVAMIRDTIFRPLWSPAHGWAGTNRI